MKASKGYFCIVQFCPNPSRLETVNVGVLLFCPDLGFIDAHMTGSIRRAKRFFGTDQVELAGLKSALRSFKKRLSVEKDAFRDRDDLQNFIGTRANMLQLTAPRPVKVLDPEKDLERLFNELVGGRKNKQDRRPMIPVLDTFFDGLVAAGRARKNETVTIPVMQRDLVCPYAYTNGVDNFVLPQRFPKQEGTALKTAGNLAIEADLLFKHANQSRLVVIPTYASSEVEESLQPRVTELFREYNVKTVETNRISEFLDTVEKEAH